MIGNLGSIVSGLRSPTRSFLALEDDALVRVICVALMISGL